MIRRLLLMTATAAVLLGLATAPAPAATSTAAVSAANGTVGVVQTVAIVAPGSARQQATLLLSLNGTPQGQLTTVLDAQGDGSVAWVPTAVGTWTIRGLAGLPASAAATVAIAPVPTRTVLFTPTAVGLGLPTQLSATVAPTGGAFMPQGTLTFASIYGPVLGSVAVSPGQGGRAVGSITWTPTALGPFPIVATFTPTGGSTVASSASAGLYVETSLPILRMIVPSSYMLGESVPMTAVVLDPLVAGTTSFLASQDGRVISLLPSTPVVSGRTTLTWVPATTGNQFVTAQFSSTDGNVSGAVTQGVAVRPPWPADPMSVASAGVGVLTTAGPTTVPGGQRIGWATSTGSGAGITLAESGPCLLDGAVLVTPRAGGTCLVTATSPGGGTLGPNTATFTILVTAA
jgi:hypothetical protein